MFIYTVYKWAIKYNPERPAVISRRRWTPNSKKKPTSGTELAPTLPFLVVSVHLVKPLQYVGLKTILSNLQ